MNDDRSFIMTSLLRRLCGISAVAIGLAAPSVAQEVPLLDLTPPPVATKVSPETTAGRGRAFSYRISTAPRHGWPVTVRLLSLDHAQYHDGDPCIAEIELEARETVVLPWSLDRAAVDPQGAYRAPGFRAMLLSLDDEKGMALEVNGQAVGSQLAPVSLKTLKAGERVRIRVAGNWAFLPGGPAHVSRGTLTLRAVLTPIDEGGYAQDPIRSQNALRIRSQ
jgi:hypothetical protein